MQLSGNWDLGRRMRRGIYCLATIMFVASGTVATADEYAPRVGSLHPAFTLPAIDDGRPISLAQYRGRKVLLIQFASW